MPKPPRAGLALAARAGPKGSRRQLLEEGLSGVLLGLIATTRERSRLGKANKTLDT